MTVYAWSEPTQDRWGDECLAHYVAICDDDGEPTGKVYHCNSRQNAIDLGMKMARDRKCDFQNETYR